MNYRTLSKLALLSILGASIMLIGDFLFFLTPWVNGETFNSSDAMLTMPKQRLMVRGILGPIAGAVYGAGFFLFYTALKQFNKMIAATITALSILAYSLAGAAHLLFTLGGFPEPALTPQLDATISTMIGYISLIIIICAGLSSGLLAYMILRYKTVFPKWSILILPLILSVLEPLIRPLIPSPFGSIIIGGWPNWSAIIYFSCLILIWRKRPQAN